MVSAQPFVFQFSVVGTLENLIGKSGDRIKYLELASEQQQYSIKVAKELSNKIGKQLKQGSLVKVTGMRKYNLHKGKVKYKAYGIELLACPEEQQVTRVVKQKTASKSKTKVLFCQKSTCWKNGGKAAYESLKTELKERGISDQVEVKTVGCLKKCKKAPNMVMNKVAYQRVKCKQIPQMMDKHLVGDS